MKWSIYIMLFFSLSCSKVQMDDCLTSAGKESSEHRIVSSFTEVVTTDKLQVVLVQDSAQDGLLVLKGPENLLAQIETKVEDGVLSLDNTNTCNFVRSFDHRIIIELHFSDLRKLWIKSASEVSNKGSLNLDKLHVLHEGLSDCELNIDVQDEVFVQSFNSAYLKLSGTARALKGSIEEVSDLDARGLLAEEVILDNHSPLNCYINASDIIFVKIYNDGNIYYVDEPANYKDLNFRRGKGDLIKLP